MLDLQKPWVSGPALDFDVCPNWKLSLRKKKSAPLQPTPKLNKGSAGPVSTRPGSNFPSFAQPGAKFRGLITTAHIPSALMTSRLPQAAGGAKPSPL